MNWPIIWIIITLIGYGMAIFGRKAETKIEGVAILTMGGIMLLLGK